MIKKSNIKYKSEQVKSVNCVEVSKIQARFILHIETKNESTEKSILVVMKNPSKATQYQSDKTVNNIIGHLWKDYSNIYIANLFPYYSTKANGLLSFFDSQDNDTILTINQKFIEDYEMKANDILIGWGTNTIGMKQQDYENEIAKTMRILFKNKKPVYYVHCCSCKNNLTGCGDNNFCSNRCKKRCERVHNPNKSCNIIRFPMHLELWGSNKQKIRY